MAHVIVYYAHPGHRSSRVNKPMAEAAAAVEGIEFVDLYRLYPRHDVSIADEQARILPADVILFQFPLFWYSTPSIIKDWIDLVLEHGFAFGAGGDKLEGKTMMLALTAAGPEDAYTTHGYQHYPLRTFLTPLEQTARLCHMHFPAPYVLHSALHAPDDGQVELHVRGYVRLLHALRDETYDLGAAQEMLTIGHSTLPVREAN